MLTRRDGEPVALRYKARQVLAELARNPGRTVSKDDLLNAVWADSIVSDESLFQCIAEIRRVIGPQSRQIIETRPREGYRLNPSAMRQGKAHAWRRLAVAEPSASKHISRF